jgi:hypothetical protein
VSGRISRRAFLVAIGGVGVGASAAWRILNNDGEGALGEVFADLDAARAVGEAYLANHPGEADERKLLAVLGLGSAVVSPADLKRLRAAVRDDYERSELRLVNGWYLSRTEARLCALSTYG